MTCQECELLLGQDDPRANAHLAECAECRALAVEIEANADALFLMRGDSLPVRGTGGLAAGRWWKWSSAVAAMLVCGFGIWEFGKPGPVRLKSEPITVVASHATVEPALPRVAPIVGRPRPHPKPAVVVARPTSEPNMVRVRTSDPNVVIYWLLGSDEDDSKEGDTI